MRARPARESAARRRVGGASRDVSRIAFAVNAVARRHGKLFNDRKHQPSRGSREGAVAPTLDPCSFLRTRDQEESARILEAITDSDVRARIEAVTIDDASAAAAQLEAIGPMFRTR